MSEIDDSTSGYTEDLDEEMNVADTLQVQDSFSDLQEIYVSASGHTRLFSATRYGKRYVLKCLKADFACVPIYRQALTKEFEIGLQLDHPNICRTIGLEDIAVIGTAIIMEYIDGDTLKDILDQHRLTKDEARKVAEQLAAALDYIHSKQIMHRDLKPSNVMLTHNGRNVKLIDFSLSDSDVFGVLKLPAGSAGYIAPEQLSPNAKPSIASDVFSFGMVMNDMASVTGDKTMRRMAEACIRRNPSARPTTKEQIFAKPKATIVERMIAAILIFLSLLLSLYIGMTLYQRTTASVVIESDGNSIIRE